MDGAIFFKQYFSIEENFKKVLEKERFKELYIPELIEMLNDEEIYIRIEAVEISTEIMEHLEESLIENEFFPCVKGLIEWNFQEITKRLC